MSMTHKWHLKLRIEKGVKTMVRTDTWEFSRDCVVRNLKRLKSKKVLCEGERQLMQLLEGALKNPVAKKIVFTQTS